MLNHYPHRPMDATARKATQFPSQILLLAGGHSLIPWGSSTLGEFFFKDTRLHSTYKVRGNRKAVGSVGKGNASGQQQLKCCMERLLAGGLPIPVCSPPNSAETAYGLTLFDPRCRNLAVIHPIILDQVDIAGS